MPKRDPKKRAPSFETTLGEELLTCLFEVAQRPFPPPPCDLRRRLGRGGGGADFFFLGDETGEGETLDRPMGMESRRLATVVGGGPGKLRRRTLKAFGETPGKGCCLAMGHGI